jgi:hypothetical protein
MVVRVAVNGTVTAESEDDVSVSMCGSLGRQAYAATRSAASDASLRRVAPARLPDALTITSAVGYITRVSRRIFRQLAT